MSSELLYLSTADVQELKISPREAREAVLACCRDNAAGRSISLHKSIIGIGPGHAFFAMPAASEASGIATVKWVAAVPAEADRGILGINGVICVSDYKTGAPVAVLDGNLITLIRTAALSAAAAVYLAPEAPSTIGFVGCGSQALSHLDAFVDLFPSLRQIHLVSRSGRSAEKVAAAASEKGLKPIIASDPEALLRESEIVVSMVPGNPGLKPFLDARLLRSPSFVAAVDAGRSWLPETLTLFDKRVTDNLKQNASPLEAEGQPKESVQFHEDVVTLASEARRNEPIRALFYSGGFAITDLALVELALRKARALGIGTSLPR